MFSLAQTLAKAEVPCGKHHLSNVGEKDMCRISDDICPVYSMSDGLMLSSPPFLSATFRSPPFISLFSFIKRFQVYFSTRSYVVPLIVPPLIAVRTFLLKPSRLLRRSSAASLFNGSEALGSKNKNCRLHFKSASQHIAQTSPLILRA
jgi:hypothetical protein